MPCVIGSAEHDCRCRHILCRISPSFWPMCEMCASRSTDCVAAAPSDAISISKRRFNAARLIGTSECRVRCRGFQKRSAICSGACVWRAVGSSGCPALREIGSPGLTKGSELQPRGAARQRLKFFNGRLAVLGLWWWSRPNFSSGRLGRGLPRKPSRRRRGADNKSAR